MIEKPQTNVDPLRRYSYEKPDEFRNLADFIQVYGLAPSTHPKVADFASGDGSIPALLRDHWGWEERQFTCFDKCKSPTRLVTVARWIYVDLIRLTEDIVNRKQLHESVASMRNSFDLLAFVQTPLRLADQRILTEYFAAENSFVYADYHRGKVVR